MAHYTYKITNKTNNKYYIGVRSCKGEPDIGVKYFSSSQDTGFMLDQTENSQNYLYEVLDTFENRGLADVSEMKLHKKLDVRNDILSYNRCNSFGMSSTGVEVSDETRQKMRDNMNNRHEVKCPHCNVTGFMVSMAQWHFDNCPVKTGIPRKTVRCPHCNSQCTVGSDKERYHFDNCKVVTGVRVGPRLITCPHCGTETTPSNSLRWHFDNCEILTGVKAFHQSEATKTKIGAGQLGKSHKRVKCPHCGRNVGARSAHRYHFDNCTVLTGKDFKRGIKMSIVECPHCGKTGAGGAMNQWHFDNCKVVTGKTKNHSESHKRKIADAHLGKRQPRVECPHCGLVGGISGMKHYHFDNCKKKPLQTPKK